MKYMLRVDVDVDHVVEVFDVVRDVILDRIDVVVDKQLMPRNIPRKPPHPVIDRHDVGVEGMDQIIQRLQRGNFPAGGYVDIGTERADPVIRMIFGVRVNA